MDKFEEVKSDDPKMAIKYSLLWKMLPTMILVKQILEKAP